MQIQVERVQFVNNDAAARRVSVGETLILIMYAFMDIEIAKTFIPALVFPNEATNLLK